MCSLKRFVPLPVWSVGEFLLGLLCAYVVIDMSPVYAEVIVHEVLSSTLPYSPLWSTVAFTSLIFMPLLAGFLFGGTVVRVSTEDVQHDILKKSGIVWVVAFMTVIMSMLWGTGEFVSSIWWQSLHVISVVAYNFLATFYMRIMAPKAGH